MNLDKNDIEFKKRQNENDIDLNSNSIQNLENDNQTETIKETENINAMTNNAEEFQSVNQVEEKIQETQSFNEVKETTQNINAMTNNAEEFQNVNQVEEKTQETQSFNEVKETTQNINTMTNNAEEFQSVNQVEEKTQETQSFNEVKETTQNINAMTNNAEEFQSVNQVSQQANQQSSFYINRTQNQNRSEEVFVNAQKISPNISNMQSTIFQNQNSYEASVLEYLENSKKNNKGKKLKKVLSAVSIITAICVTSVASSYFTMQILNENNNQDNNVLSSIVGSLSSDISNLVWPTIDIVNNGASDTTIPMTDNENPVKLTVPQIYAKVSDSVVGIQVQSLYYGYSSSGTGIIMSDEGYVITNNHVIDEGDIITVVLESGSQYTAEIIGKDSETDLAVLKFTPNEELTVAEFGNSDALVVGDLAIAIGNPGGLELQGSMSGGYISAVEREIIVGDTVMSLIQTDAAINPGNSGGPLINDYGQVIGINTIKIGDVDYEGLGFAIPINSAKIIIEELIEKGYIAGRPSIGITGYSITEEIANYNNVPQGLLVKSVDTRSDAYRQGLKENDIIYGVNGIDTPTIDELNAIKDQYTAGDKITLNVFRANKNIEIEIMLMDEVDLENSTTQSTQQSQEKQYYPNIFGN